MILRIVFFLLMVAIIAIGIAIIQNGVPIANTTPGLAARMRRFMTVDWAATSTDGDGLAQCASMDELAARKPIVPEPHVVMAVARPRIIHHRRRRRHSRRMAAVSTPMPSPVATPARSPAAPTATGTPAANGSGAPVETDNYPELVRHSYPGIPPEQLFQMAAATAVSIPQWTVEAVNPGDMTINAIYHTRLLPLKNDIRIVVTGLSEVDVCSESRVGEPGVNSVASLFPGDLGANIGHIQQFYVALAPMVAQVYKLREEGFEKRLGATTAAP